MIRIFALAAVIASVAFTAPPAHAGSAGGMSAREVIAASDAIRNPDKPFSVTVTLTEFVSGRPRDSVAVEVYSKPEEGSGQFRTLVEFRQPVRDAGKLMLRVGQEVWFYDPAAKSSIRISPQQRLLGQASNGDVMTANFALDYDAKLVGRDVIKDAERVERDCLRLAMTSARTGTTYDAIEYWVDAASFRPVKGKFYSDSGRLLKVAYYTGFKPELGVERPTEVLIVDGVDQTRVTRLSMSGYAHRDIPEAWYQRGYLPRFRAE